MRSEADAEFVRASDLCRGNVTHMAEIPMEAGDGNSRILHFEPLEVVQMSLDLICGDQMLMIDPASRRDPFERFLI